MCDVSKGGGGGSPEKRTYHVSHGHNRYVRLPLLNPLQQLINFMNYFCYQVLHSHAPRPDPAYTVRTRISENINIIQRNSCSEKVCFLFISSLIHLATMNWPQPKKY